MSDDRFSEEQKEIDEAALANPRPSTCGAQHRDGWLCELGPGHVGDHRRTLGDSTKVYWWDVVDPTEIEREAKKWEPPPKKPGGTP